MKEIAEVVQEVVEHFIEVPRMSNPYRNLQRTVEPNSVARGLQEQVMEVEYSDLHVKDPMVDIPVPWRMADIMVVVSMLPQLHEQIVPVVIVAFA